MWGRSDLRPRVCRPLAPGHEARQGQQRPWFLGWELRSGLAHRAGLAHRWDRQAFGPPVAGLDDILPTSWNVCSATKVPGFCHACIPPPGAQKWNRLDTRWAIPSSLHA
jgi:hypothetical protein